MNAHVLFGNLEATRIPLTVHWGIYARQSSLIQLINNVESTEMQTEDLGKWLRLRNVPENQITLFDADLGVSGRLAIHERQGLFDLVMSIYEGKIKAVLVYNVSRLFRDLSGIQYAVFAELCRQNDCVVVTAQDGMIYDFNQYIYVTLFHMQCRSAAEFLEQQVKLLQDARIKKSFRGEYASLGPVPTGYLVDNREESLYFEKFMVYEPHAEKVYSLLERYYTLEGNFSYLIRELDTQIAKGIPIFPAFAPWVDKRIVNDKRWKRRALPCDGYGITPKGLERMFCNLAYLGIWVKPNGELIHTNHPRMVDADHEYLFWYAFERNSKVLLDGQPNEKREALKGATRYYQTHTEDPYGLLKDDKLAPAQGDGFIYVHHYQGRWIYSNVPNPHQLHKTNIRSVPTHLVDDAFTSVFFERLKESRDFDEYRQWVGKERKRQKDTNDLIAIQLSTIADKQTAIMDDILDLQTQVKQGKMTAEEAEPMKQFHRQKFVILETEKKKLEESQRENTPNETMQIVQQLADFQTELAKLIPLWEQKPFKERKDFVGTAPLTGEIGGKA